MGNSIEEPSPKSDKPREPDNRQLLSIITQLKEHVVQIEAMVAYLLVCVAVLNVLDAAIANTKYSYLTWLVPCLFLIGLPLIVRVTNPESPTRNRIVWAAALGGLFGTIGGGVAVFPLSSNGGLGTLIGIAVGIVVGAFYGNNIEGIGRGDELLDRGEAFDYLYQKRRRSARIANAERIDNVLDQLPSFDKNRDGRQWYSVDDLDRVIRERS